MDIAPAVQMGDSSRMSAEEFQHQLCSWLDNKGMLKELRAYLKSNMIEILRNTSSGTSLRLKSNVRQSPKIQALNFLISEYLAHSEYHFSLSVFATEVSLTNSVAKDKGFKFNEGEVYDILEALGIMRHNKQAMCIYFMYKEGSEPLLSYFLPSPPVFSGNREDVDGFHAILNGEFEFAIHNITKILINSNLLPEEINQLKYYIKWIADKHKEREERLESTLRVEFKLQLSKYKVKIHDLEKGHQLQRKMLEAKLEDVKEKLIILSKKEQDERENAKLREINAAQAQEKRLKETQKYNRASLEKSFDNRYANQPKQTTDVAVSTDIIQETKGLQCSPDDCDPEKLKQELDRDRQTLKSVSVENNILKSTILKLEKENESLKVDNCGFSKQLEDLAKRATVLMNELNISQMNMLRLSGVLSTVSEGNVIPSTQNLAYTGAGEEYFQTGNVIPPQFRPVPRTARTKKPNVKSSSSSSRSRSPSPTDSVLQNARERLQNLEEESNVIDRSMQQINVRKPTVTLVTPPELGTTTPNSPNSEPTESSMLGLCSALANITSKGTFLTANENTVISI